MWTLSSLSSVRRGHGTLIAIEGKVEANAREIEKLLEAQVRGAGTRFKLTATLGARYRILSAGTCKLATRNPSVRHGRIGFARGRSPHEGRSLE